MFKLKKIQVKEMKEINKHSTYAHCPFQGKNQSNVNQSWKTLDKGQKNFSE